MATLTVADRLTAEEMQVKIKTQEKENIYHRFTQGHLIIKQGLINKRKVLSAITSASALVLSVVRNDCSFQVCLWSHAGTVARRRMFLLTEGPHFYYVDPQGMELKGEIPW
jgi:3-phosphoinositide dependent protein kinase-1